ncbi:DegT/DnrJ/EryC1/StrS aminotransferase family protein [uncultured Thiodictyon sp.]|uniref:DegT/DnrJ/EryC1/StrS family aminotransferase n=1 Tax=uncultured Thiodictyon sp. TaxID=1846217 RepID=UPI0025FC588A|nr:DegT/DnrJ/EryC1/StrS family aminotransferase [uncultured Thiodictyon sp.]
MDLLLDTDCVVAGCVPEAAPDADSLAALSRCAQLHATPWLYAGAAQAYEDGVHRALQEAADEGAAALAGADLPRLARQRLQTFTQGKQWLAALAGDCASFDSADPARERLLHALGRFTPGTIKVLTGDAAFLAACPDQAVSPAQYLALPPSAQRVDFIDLPSQQSFIRPELEERVHRVLHHGRYILGPEMDELEQALQSYTGAAHCITVASGTEALLISLMALGVGPGDEVITTPFTFVATAEVICLVGARPVFVDVEPETCNIDASKIEGAITPRTKAIMPVSLYGQPADMDEINAIAHAYQLRVIEDACQSFGASYRGRRSCNLSTIGCTSFFPSKPLGCYGDGGAIFTNRDDLAEIMRELRVHGQERRYVHTRIGVGGRMDTLQCAVLLAKWPRFEWEVERRMAIAQRYSDLFAGAARIKTPVIRADRTCVFAQYTLQVSGRDALVETLQSRGVPSAVHYPIPLNNQPAYEDIGCPECTPVAARLAASVISLPMHADLRESDQDLIASAVIAATGH